MLPQLNVLLQSAIWQSLTIPLTLSGGRGEHLECLFNPVGTDFQSVGLSHRLLEISCPFAVAWIVQYFAVAPNWIGSGWFLLQDSLRVPFSRPEIVRA